MSVHINNKKAYYEFDIQDKYIAGIVLTGTEIKSVRNGKVNLNDSFCYFQGKGLYVRNMHISEYEMGTHYNHEPKQERRLLLQKREMRKWESKVKERGWAIIPLSMFINERGFAKLEIGLAKGKKIYDKRQSIKERDLKRRGED